MPIIKNGKNISAIYKGNTPILKICKGLNVIWEAFKTLVLSGIPPLSFFSKGEPLIDYKIYGNSEQDGTPTPEAPIEIESVGDKTKNLCSLGTKTLAHQVLYTLAEPIQPGTYTISANITTTYTGGSTCLMMLCDNNDAQIVQAYLSSNGTRSNRTITTKATTYKIRLYAANGWAPAQGHTVTWSNIQIEEGWSATSYEPYGYRIPILNNETATNIYLNEPLRKIGDYADYIDFENQKEFRNVEVLDDTGTLTIEESYKGVVDDTGTNIELPTISTQAGTNVLSVDTEIKPSNVEITYKGK